MAGPTDVLLARHGETDHNAAARFQGRLDPPLNDRGREQAAALAEAVASDGLVALLASPLLRARQTAEIVAERLGLQPRFDARFAEIDVGDWAGRTWAEVIAENPGALQRWHAADRDFRFPGGESVAEQSERVAAGLADLRATGPLPALVVCHGGTIRVALGAAGATTPTPNGSVHRL
jgi:broad specificity phosphatase PhoE